MMAMMMPMITQRTLLALLAATGAASVLSEGVTLFVALKDFPYPVSGSFPRVLRLAVRQGASSNGPERQPTESLFLTSCT
jgi:hypothetical protein